MITFTATKPDSIIFTAAITMSLGDWKKLREALRNTTPYQHWPAAQVVNQINDLVTQAERQYWPPSETSQGEPEVKP